MLTMVTVQNARGDTLLLPLMDSSAGYVVKNIQGLDPGKATLSSSSLAEVDGADPQNAHREPRNITMKIGLEPDYAATSVAGLRSNLYKYLMPKSVVIFSLYTDNTLWATTVATVESFENDMFTADPEVNISLICYDPDFYAPIVTTVSGNTVNTPTDQLITYPGTTDTGLEFSLTFPSNQSEIRLYNTRPDNLIQLFTLAGTFLTNDVLKINTKQRQKGVTITRAGLEYSVLYFLAAGSNWLSLTQGDNLFRAYVNTSPIPFTLSYMTKYGGL